MVKKKNKEERRGRPTIFSQDVVDKLIEARKEGLPATIAVKHAGISKDCLYKWLRKGREEGEGEFYDLAIRWDKAEADFTLANLEKIKEAKDWKSAQYLLSVTHPELFNPQFMKYIKADIKSDTKLRIDDLFDEEVMKEVLDGSDGSDEGSE